VIERPPRVSSNAARSARHRSHDEAVLASRDYPDRIRYMCLGDEQLRPVEHQAFAGALCLKRDVTSAPSAGALGKGVRVDVRPARNRRKIFLLLRLRSRKEQKPDDDLIGNKRAREQRSSSLFDHDTQIVERQSGAAEVSGNHQAVPSEFRDLSPQLRAVALLVDFHRAHMLLGTFLREEVASGVFQQFLFFV